MRSGEDTRGAMADNGGRWAAGMKPETDEASRGRMRERQRVDGMLILSVEQITKGMLLKVGVMMCACVGV
jgi:hypothetical protein